MGHEMTASRLHITGVGSVSPFGPSRGLVGQREITPRVFGDAQASGTRRAFLVAPFRPGDVVPGLKTRRLDRLSVWSLVAAHLALQDAQINLQDEDRSRFAVVFGTGFGCTELTEAYLRTVARYGYAKSDPIIFPETLDNFPASHVARNFGLKGPNITVSCRGISGEAALIQAASLLQSGEADRVLVIAGDTLNRPLYEWYESAKFLSAACSGGHSAPALLSAEGDGFMPGEGLAGFVMESGEAYADRGAKVYAHFRSGSMGGDPTVAPFSWGHCSKLTAELIRKVLGSADPANVVLAVASANGSPGLDMSEAESIQEVFGCLDAVDIAMPKALLGEFDGNAILRLTVALSGLGIRRKSRLAPDIDNQPKMQGCNSRSSEDMLLLLLGASAGGGRAAISFYLASAVLKAE